MERSTFENIRTRILNTEPSRVSPLFSIVKNKQYKAYQPLKKRNKPKGLMTLFLYYCFLLEIYPKKNLQTKLTPEMRTEVRKMEQYSAEARFLCKNKISTIAELNAYKSDVIGKLNDSLRKRETLWKRRSRAKTETEKYSITEEISKVTDIIKLLKKEIGLCGSIETRSTIMVRNIQEMEVHSKYKAKNVRKDLFCR